MMKYNEKLQRAVADSGSCLCVGLDPHLHLMPQSVSTDFPDQNTRVVKFLETVIEVTAPYCAAFKPNLAFFEALGKKGLEVFEQVIEKIPGEKIIIADAKRGDIGSTARSYKKAFFDQWDVDAITLNPLMGFDTLAPYFDYPSKAGYVLSLTSNPGASDFLNKPFSGFGSMAEFIAAELDKMQPESMATLGMVVGATYPLLLAPVLKRYPSAPLLIPGIGAQGGKIDELVAVLKEHRGVPLISSSRSIIFAGGDEENWYRAVENRAREFSEKLMPVTENYV